MAQASAASEWAEHIPWHFIAPLAFSGIVQYFPSHSWTLLCKHLLWVQIPRETGFKAALCLYFCVCLIFSLKTFSLELLWSSEHSANPHLGVGCKRSSEVKPPIWGIESLSSSQILMFSLGGIGDVDLWCNPKKESQRINRAVSWWIEMSVQVFQSLISLSAKDRYNMDKEQGREFRALRGKPGKDLQWCLWDNFLKYKEGFVRWWRGKGILFRGDKFRWGGRPWVCTGWAGWGNGDRLSREIRYAFLIVIPSLGTKRTVSSLWALTGQVNFTACKESQKGDAACDRLDLPFLSLLCKLGAPSFGTSSFLCPHLWV